MDHIKLSTLAVGDRFKYPYDHRHTYTVTATANAGGEVQCKRDDGGAFTDYFHGEHNVVRLAPEPKTEFRFSDLEFDYSEDDNVIQIRGYEDRDGTPFSEQRFTIDLPPAKAARLIEELSTRLARIL